MPSRTALTESQWYEKALATLPDWFLKDIEASIIRAHLRGLAAVLSTVEQDLYDHIDQTFLERAESEFLDAHAAERVIPYLKYSGTARVDQIQRLGSRSSLSELKSVIDNLLTVGTCEVQQPIDESGSSFLDIDYDDNGDAVDDWETQSNTFQVLIDEQTVDPFTFADRSAFASRTAYAGTTATTEYIADLIVKALAVYKAAGFLYRISVRT